MADEASTSAFDGSRKSERERRQKRSFSPDLDLKSPKNIGQNIKKKKKVRSGSAFSPDRPYDRLSNGMPFSCDLCKSPYVCIPQMSKRASRVKRSKHMPSPQAKTDPVTGKTLLLCNACGSAYGRPGKVKKVKPVSSQEEKEKYLREAQSFADCIATETRIPEAQVLYCPNFKMTPCQCIQTYVTAEGDKEEMHKRILELTDLHKQAKELAAQKFYDTGDNAESGKKEKRAKTIGLGNGQKKSAAYEAFVLEKREILRSLDLCERGTQKILKYSNNFLHKKLKTEQHVCRVKRVKGKAALGMLHPLNELHKEKCCIDNCVRMSLTHPKILHQWRGRASLGQREARRVLAEMLIPSGGVRSNCYRFISWVTGCSASTIGKVNEQMKLTGGEREPPQHGLRQYWKTNPRRISSSLPDHMHNKSGDDTSAVGVPDTSDAESSVSQHIQTVLSNENNESSLEQTEQQKQQQITQQQMQLLKVLEQRLLQTSAMQQTLMQHITRPQVPPVNPSIQGLPPKMSQVQNVAASLTVPSSVSARHGIPLEGAQLGLQSQAMRGPQPGGVASGPSASAVHPGSGQVITADQVQNQYSTSHHQPTVHIPVVNNNNNTTTSPSILQLQAPISNLHIKLSQTPQYIIQGSSQKASAVTNEVDPAQASRIKTKNQVPKNNGTVQSSSSGNEQAPSSSANITVSPFENGSLVKIGNQLHRAVYMGLQNQGQMIGQSASVANIQPNAGLRVPVIQSALRCPVTPNPQVHYISSDTNQMQMPQFVALAPVSIDQLQQTHVPSLCIPSRLQVAPSIPVQQLQMLMQHQKHQQQPSEVARTSPTKNKAADTCDKTVTHQTLQEEHVEQSQEVLQTVNSHDLAMSVDEGGIRLGSTSKAGSSSEKDTLNIFNRSQESSAYHVTAGSTQSPSEPKRTAMMSNSTDSTSVSSKLNYQDLEHQTLSEYYQSADVSQETTSGLNCAYVVPVHNRHSEISSSEAEEMLKSVVINRHGELDLISPLTIPDSLTRSRNNSGESNPEPAISVDLLNILSQQGLTITISNGQLTQSNG